MAFQPLALPPETPPLVEQLIRGAVQPFLLNVHAMFQLPTSDTLEHVGCNLSIAQVLLASISGVSAIPYSTTGGTGTAFREFMIACYPWDAEPLRSNAITGPAAAEILYEEYRNPLTHASGTSVFSVRGKRREYRPQQRRVQINRINIEVDARPGRGLTEHRITELESQVVRPAWLTAPTLKFAEGTLVLTVEALYWGFRSSIQRLCSDRARMEAAVRFFRLRER